RTTPHMLGWLAIIRTRTPETKKTADSPLLRLYERLKASMRSDLLAALTRPYISVRVVRHSAGVRLSRSAPRRPSNAILRSARCLRLIIVHAGLSKCSDALP